MTKDFFFSFFKDTEVFFRFSFEPVVVFDFCVIFSVGH